MVLMSAAGDAFRGHTRKPQPSLTRGSLCLTLRAFPQESPPSLPTTPELFECLAPFTILCQVIRARL